MMGLAPDAVSVTDLVRKSLLAAFRLLHEVTVNMDRLNGELFNHRGGEIV